MTYDISHHFRINQSTDWCSETVMDIASNNPLFLVGILLSIMGRQVFSCC